MIKQRSGFVVLSSTLVVMAVVLIYLVFAQQVTSSLLDDTFHNRLGSESDYVAESCLEDTLLLLRADEAYAGGTMNLADGVCEIDVAGVGSTKNITIVASTLSTYYRTLTAEVEILSANDTMQIILNNISIN